MLFVVKIIEENFENSQGEDVVANCSELVQVKEAIERLDGEKRTAVILEKDSNNYMVIGSGLGGKYICYAQLKGKIWVMANKFDVQKPALELVVGGKKGTYPSKRVFNLQMVLESAKHFADRGVLAQTFNWENQ